MKKKTSKEEILKRTTGTPTENILLEYMYKLVYVELHLGIMYRSNDASIIYNFAMQFC